MFSKLVCLYILFDAAIAVQEQDVSKNYSTPGYLLDHRLGKNFNQSLVSVLWGITDSLDFTCLFKLKMLNEVEKYCDVSIAFVEGFGDIYGIMANKTMFELNLIGITPSKNKQITLIDTNNCKSDHLEFPDDDYYHLLVYDNSFHVTTKNKEKCGQEHSPCMIRYNHDGEQIGEPVPFPSKNYRHAMVVDRHNSSSGGFFTTYEKIKGHKYQMNVSRVSNDGTETVLFKNDVLIRSALGVQVQSNEYGYFSFCYRQSNLNGEVTCMQYDAMGKKKLDIQFYLPRYHRMIKLFNLRQGGVILMYFKCYPRKCSTTDVYVRIPSYGPSIQLTKVGLFTYFGEEGEEFSIDHMEMDTQHCFYFIKGPHRGDFHHNYVFEYVKKCIDTEQLSIP